MAVVKTGFCIATALATALLATACDQAQAPAPTLEPVAEAPPPPPPPPPAPVEIVGDFGVIDSWQSYGGGPAVEGLVDGSFTLGPNVGAMSRASLAAKEGDKFTVDYSVKLVEAPKNKKPAMYVVGPMFLDDKGAVLAWGNVEQPLTEETRTARVELVAPAGTAVVHLYIAGMWAADGATPDGKIAFTAAKLEALK